LAGTGAVGGSGAAGVWAKTAQQESRSADKQTVLRVI
jgi:hypothetical protein